MRNFFVAFLLALLVVLTSVSVRRSVVGIGGTPPPMPPDYVAIGGTPPPMPPDAVRVVGMPATMPPN